MIDIGDNLVNFSVSLTKKFELALPEAQRKFLVDCVKVPFIFHCNDIDPWVWMWVNLVGAQNMTENLSPELSG